MAQLFQYNKFVWGFDSEVERIDRYVPGGFHPVHLGDIFRSDQATYRVMNKLGWGSFSTVWLARTVIGGQETTKSRFVALKFCAADSDASHELQIYSRLDLAQKSQETHVLELRDSFSVHGPNGTHVVLVHDVVGTLDETLLLPIQKPLKVTRRLCRQIVKGVSYLHANGVVHGDLYSSNIGVSLPNLNKHSAREVLKYFEHPAIRILLPHLPSSRPESMPLYQVSRIEIGYYYQKKEVSFSQSPFVVKILDLGSASVFGEEPRPSCLPPHVCAPELMFDRITTSKKSPSTRESDIWSLGCLMHEIVQGNLFHMAEVDIYQLGKIAKLCGEIPPEWIQRLPDLADVPVSKELADAAWKDRRSRGLNEAELAQFRTLIRWMLKIDPKARPTAEEVLQHPWFSENQDGEDCILGESNPAAEITENFVELGTFENSNLPPPTSGQHKIPSNSDSSGIAYRCSRQ